MRSGVLRLVWIACVVGCQSSGNTGVVALVGADVYRGTGTELLQNAVLLMEGGRFLQVGDSTTSIPRGAARVDLSGKYLVPGLVNTHGHATVSDTGVAAQEALEAILRLYAQYGVTTVNSLGGGNVVSIQVRDGEGTSLDRARLMVAGPVIDGNTAAGVVTDVTANAELGVDFIKIRVDDNLGTTQKMTADVSQAVINAAHANELPLAAHLFYLDDAKQLVRDGADFVAHSVRDRPVDDELINLLLTRDVCYSPTLTRELSTFVYEDEPDFFRDPFFLEHVSETELTRFRDPERQASVRESRSAQLYKAALPVATANLKRLSDAGVRISLGTDTGPVGRFQGYFEHLELQMMSEAGLSPAEILEASTGAAAACLRRTDVGEIAAGRWADFIILDENPLTAVGNLRSISSVWIAGNLVPTSN